MRCREARLRIQLDCDGRLPLEQGFELAEHLRGCADCAALRAGAARLEEALARRDVPPGLAPDVDALLARAHAARAGGARPPRWRVARHATAAAATLLVAALGVASVAALRGREAGEAPASAVAERLDARLKLTARPPLDRAGRAPVPMEGLVLGSWQWLLHSGGLDEGAPLDATVPTDPEDLSMTPTLTSWPLLAAFAVAAPASAAPNGYTVRPGWPITLSGSSVDGGAMVQLDGDSDLELLQAVGGALHAYNLDGSVVPGWPVQLDAGLGTFAAPSVGDIDGDGQDEIVACTFQFGIGGRVWALERDGSIVPGWPNDLGGTLKGVALADSDGDGDLEVALSTNVNGLANVHLLNGDGGTLAGWPQILDDVTGSSPAFGDVDGDGIPEIVAVSFQQLYVFEPDGTPQLGFPFNPVGQTFNYNTPSLVDLDGDGAREIVTATSNEVGQGGRVHVLDALGAPLPGWPKTIDRWTLVPPTVGDVDGDGFHDIVVGDTVLSPVQENKIYGWDRFGTELAGFPIGPLDAFHSQIVLADVDGDGSTELVVEQNVASSDFLAFNHDGTPVAGWPLAVQGSSFQQLLNVGDMDGDGLVDLAGSGNLIAAGDTVLYLWTSSFPFDATASPLTTWGYGPLRDGVADDSDCGFSTYCTSKPSSIAGCVPSLTATGAPSASAGSGFLIQAAPTPGVNAGLFIYSTQGALGAPISTPFGSLCLESPFFRIAAQTAGGSLGVCDGSYQVDFNQHVATQVVDPALVAGVEVVLQAWYRDPPNPGAANLTEAGRFVLCP